MPCYLDSVKKSQLDCQTHRRSHFEPSVPLSCLVASLAFGFLQQLRRPTARAFSCSLHQVGALGLSFEEVLGRWHCYQPLPMDGNSPLLLKALLLVKAPAVTGYTSDHCLPDCLHSCRRHFIQIPPSHCTYCHLNLHRWSCSTGARFRYQG